MLESVSYRLLLVDQFDLNRVYRSLLMNLIKPLVEQCIYYCVNNLTVNLIFLL